MTFTTTECRAKIAAYSAAIDARLSGGAIKRSTFGGDSLDHYSLAELESGLALWRKRLAVAGSGGGLQTIPVINGIPS